MRIGIDPGLSGAIAWLEGGIAQSVDLPTMAKTYGKGRELDILALDELLQPLLSLAPTVYVERVNAMPGSGRRRMGATSAFSFGEGVGALRALLVLRRVPMVSVLPRAWKARAGLLGKPKEASLSLARDLWPQLDLGKKRDIGRAEALLIARFGG